MLFFFAWVDEFDIFDPAVHATDATMPFAGKDPDGSDIGHGEDITELQIDHAEGDFATLKVTLRNPKLGLLAAGRNIWCMLSADYGEGDGPELEFRGRLIGIPVELTKELVELQFIARSSDFVTQKQTVADGLTVLPYVDPVWLQDKLDADSVLEAYPLRYHIDRVTHEISTSDIIDGEDGTIEITQSNATYDDLEVTYGDPPLRSFAIKLDVSWNQEAEGDLDITREVCLAFDASSTEHYGPPYVITLTGDGLFSSWPKALDEHGGGWSYGDTWSIEPATWFVPKVYSKRFIDQTDPNFGQKTIAEWMIIPEAGTIGMPQGIRETVPYGTYQVDFKLDVFKINAVMHYKASRQRTESVVATLEADVQSLVVDPGATEQDEISLSSSTIGEPIDFDGGIPIGDLRSDAYFKTDRGAQSFEYALLYGRARLLARARAVTVKVVTPWATVKGISCRKSLHVLDPRLPAGEATGKTTAYSLLASGSGVNKANISIGCTVGHGVALGIVPAGLPDYVEDGYVQNGYQSRSGGWKPLLTADLQYESFDNFDITGDDGVNFFNMTPAKFINGCVVAGGVNAQKAAIDSVMRYPKPVPDAALSNTPTVVNLTMNSVEGGPFHADYAPDVSTLVVPKTIDTEAAPL